MSNEADAPEGALPALLTLFAQGLSVKAPDCGRWLDRTKDPFARSKSSSSYSLLLHSTHLKGLFESLLLLPGREKPFVFRRIL